MATLSVLKFPTADGAQKMESTLLDLQKHHIIEVQDAAIVTWPQGKKKPKTEQLRSLTGAGALGGAFWGMLFGLISSSRSLAWRRRGYRRARRKFADYGIDDNFIKQTREQVTEGTSALFLLTKARCRTRSWRH